MRPIRIRLLPLAAVLGLVATAALAQLTLPPLPTRRINDYARALSPTDRDRLERQLAERERGASNQVVVAIFRSLRGESLEDFSVRLGEAWKVGRKGLDNGVLFLVFLDDKKLRIEVGYGLEATLTDAIAASIIRDTVAPRFREGRLAEGIGAGLDGIQAAIAGTYAASRRPGGGVMTGHGLVLAGLALIVLTALPLLALSLVQARRTRRVGWTGSRAGWSGGAGGGGGWLGGFPPGSGGGVDFGGGGGRFGGGGASGSW